MNDNKVYVGNLPFITSEADLYTLFGAFGSVHGVNIINDRETGKPRGFAFVELGSSNEAKAAINGANQQQLHGRPIVVREARSRTPGNRGGFIGTGGGGGGGGSYGGFVPGSRGGFVGTGGGYGGFVGGTTTPVGAGGFVTSPYGVLGAGATTTALPAGTSFVGAPYGTPVAGAGTGGFICGATGSFVSGTSTGVYSSYGRGLGSASAVPNAAVGTYNYGSGGGYGQFS